MSRSNLGLLFFGALTGVLLSHSIWLGLHRANPVWDMAHHQWMGLRLVHAVADGAPITDLIRLSDYYPPLYYLQEAVIIALVGPNPWLPLLANLTGLVLLSYCTYRLASGWLGSLQAEAAGILVLLFPMVAWASRESLLDVALSGWVVASVLVLVRSQWLSNRQHSMLFGVLLAAGMLTKWTFPIFIVPPVIYGMIRATDRRQALKNLLAAILLALPPILAWYLPNLLTLAGHLKGTADAAVLEGDPTAWEWRGWVYYPRSLLSYYLFLPLAAMLAWGLVRWALRSSPRSTPVGLLVSWLLGSMLLLTLLEPKDPRYAMPLAAPTALLLVWVWRQSRPVVLGMLIVAFVQFLAVSFPSPLGEFKLATDDWADTRFDYRPAGREWVWFQTSYFGELGAPRYEDWGFRTLLEVIPEDSLTGFLPELPRFHAKSLLLASELKRHNLKVLRIGTDEESLEALLHVEFAVSKSGAQGISYLTSFNHEALERIHDSGWQLLHEAKLPDGSTARVWRNPEPLTLESIDPTYAKLRLHLQELAREVLPADSQVLTICHGDDELLTMLGPGFSHFPQAANGGYLGYHTADSSEAIAHLLELQSKGAEYLLIPQTSMWWLDYYSEFAQHLEAHADLAYRNPDLATIYWLQPD